MASNQKMGWSLGKTISRAARCSVSKKKMASGKENSENNSDEATKKDHKGGRFSRAARRSFSAFSPAFRPRAGAEDDAKKKLDSEKEITENNSDEAPCRPKTSPPDRQPPRAEDNAKKKMHSEKEFTDKNGDEALKEDDEGPKTEESPPDSQPPRAEDDAKKKKMDSEEAVAPVKAKAPSLRDGTDDRPIHVVKSDSEDDAAAFPPPPPLARAEADPLAFKASPVFVPLKVDDRNIQAGHTGPWNKAKCAEYKIDRPGSKFVFFIKYEDGTQQSFPVYQLYRSMSRTEFPRRAAIEYVKQQGVESIHGWMSVM